MKYLSLFLFLTGWGILSAQSNVVYAEWFIDQDPGLGMANPFTGFTSSESVQVIDQIPLNDLVPGVHRFYVRVKDDKGRWSHTMFRNFLLLPKAANAPITYLEWFWDIDPGLGKANAVPIGIGDTIDGNWSIDLANLPIGIHHLYVRVRNTDGVWSHAVYRSTLIRSEPNAMIEKFTYTYRDPFGEIGPFTYTLAEPRHFVDLSFDLNTEELVSGQTYDLCLKAIRTDGQESCEQCSTFSWSRVVNTVDEGDLFRLEIFPNPNTGEFKIRLPQKRSGAILITLIDPLGRKLYSKTIMPGNLAPIDVNIDHLVSGAYFAILEMGNAVQMKKIVVK